MKKFTINISALLLILIGCNDGNQYEFNPLISITPKTNPKNAIFSTFKEDNVIISWSVPKGANSKHFFQFWNLDGDLLGGYTTAQGLNNETFSPDGTYMLAESLELFDKDTSNVILINLLPMLTGELKAINEESNSDEIFMVKEKKIITGYKYDLGTSVFSKDGDRILTFRIEEIEPDTVVLNLKERDLEGNLISSQSIKEEKSEPYDIVNSKNFSPDGTKLLLRQKNSIILWDINSNEIKDILSVEYDLDKNDIRGDLKFSPDGQYILAVNLNRSLYMYEIMLFDLDGNKITSIKVAEKMIEDDAFFSPNGTNICAFADTTLMVWDLNGNLISKIETTTKVNKHFTFSPDNSKILTLESQGVKVWNLEGQLITNIVEQEKNNEYRNFANFSPEGSKIATHFVNQNEQAVSKIYNLEGNLLQTVKSPIGSSIANFSQDGKYVVVTSTNKETSKDATSVINVFELNKVKKEGGG